MELNGLEKALTEGCTLTGFISGGGLRVIRVLNKEKLCGYGEHPRVEEALSHANEDFLAGGRPYKEVYGKLKPHYLTGLSKYTSELDSWMLNGGKIQAYKQGENYLVELKISYFPTYAKTYSGQQKVKKGESSNLDEAFNNALKAKEVIQ
jgi:hypothetical protein